MLGVTFSKVIFLDLWLLFTLICFLVGPLAKTIAFAILHKVKAHDKRWAKILVISGTMALFYGNVYVILWISLQQSVGDAIILWSCLVDKCYHGFTNLIF